MPETSPAISPLPEPVPDEALTEVLRLWRAYLRREIGFARMQLQMRILLSRFGLPLSMLLPLAEPGGQRLQSADVDALAVIEARILEWRWLARLRAPDLPPDAVWQCLAEEFASGAGSMSVSAPGLELEVPFTDLRPEPESGAVRLDDGVCRVALVPLVRLSWVVRPTTALPTLPRVVLGLRCERADGCLLTFWRR